MKTISDYIIYCTEEQTRKAHKLGAPLNIDYHSDDFENSVKIRSLCYVEIPTAEQLIGYIEAQPCIDHIRIFRYNNGWDWSFTIFLSNYDTIEICHFNSRPEATLAAIDTALEYLSNNKK